MNRLWISRVAMLVLSMAGWVLAAGELHAQSYPNKAISFLVPYGPGTGIDVVARVIAQKLSDNWGQPVVVENRPGATGGIALEMTAKAPPDGYTIIIASGSQIINQHASKARYDMVRDFAPVSLAALQPLVLAVSNDSSAKSMSELVALAKSRPGKLNYAATPASTFHFMGEMLKSAQKIDLVMIPYKSTTDAVTDLVSGRVEIWFTQLPTALPLVKSGKIRVLGISGEKRSNLLPEVPTMVEVGTPEIDVSSTLFIVAPAATPRPIINALNGEIAKVLATKEIADRLTASGFEPKSSTPEELGAFIKSEVVRWGKVVKESGIRLD